MRRLMEVHFCGHSKDDLFALIEVARDLDLTQELYRASLEL